MGWFSKKEKKQQPVFDIFEQIESERKYWQDIINLYKENLEYLKKEYERAENRKWELICKQPNYEFILENRETGWVWAEPIDNYKNLNIGDFVKLQKSETETVTCKVITFNGVHQYKDFAQRIVFNVEEYKCPPTINQSIK